MYGLTYFDMGTCLYMFEQKKQKKNHNFIYKYVKNCETMRLSTHSIVCIFISTVQKMFDFKNIKIKNSISHFLSDLHQIFTVLFEKFYSFY